MGLGAPAISTNQKREASGTPGPPFALTSAAEGLSVDPVTGKIVLGTDGTYGTPDQFTVTRIMEVSNHLMFLQDTTSGGPGLNSFMSIGSDRILGNSGNGNVGIQAIFGNTQLQFNLYDFQTLKPQLGLATGFNDVNLRNEDGILFFDCAAQTLSMRMDLVAYQFIIAPTAVPSNGRTLQVNGNVSILTDFTIVGLDFPNTAAQTSSDISSALAIGSLPGDVVMLGVDPASVLPNSTFTAWISAPDTVTVRFNNYSAAAQDPPAGNFKVSVIKMA